MIDDGTGHDISIPLIMVEKNIGVAIRGYIIQNRQKGIKLQPKISI